MGEAVWAVAAYLEAIGGTSIAGTGLTIGALATEVAAIAAISALSQSLVSSGLSDGLTRGSTLQMRREPNPVGDVIYGRARTGGYIVFAQGTYSNAVLNLVNAHAVHEVDAYEDVYYVNDTPVHFIANEAQGAYHDYITLVRHLGADDQTYDTILYAEVGGSVWAGGHRLRGIAYTYFRLVFEPELFPGGVPNLSAQIRGRKVYDPRDGGQDQGDESTWLWSDNPALCLLDYLTNSDFGLGVDYATEINADSFIAAANACDETVELAWVFTEAGDTTSGSNVVANIDTTDIATGMPVSGPGIPARTVVIFVGADYILIDKNATATASSAILVFGDEEPRYRCGGVFRTDVEPMDVIENLIKTMAGELYYVGGTWICHAGVARTGTVEIDIDNIVGPIETQTRDPMRETCNRVRGKYSYPGDAFVERDFPSVVNSTYLSEDDGYELWRDLDLPWVQSASQAQRIAKIALELARQDITLEIEMNLNGLGHQAGDVVEINLARYGWSEKKFHCTGWSFDVRQSGQAPVDGNQSAPVPVIRMGFREYAAATYDWDSGEETTVDPAPNTTLPPDYLGST